MSKHLAKKSIKPLPIEDLKPHPKQSTFAPLSEAELQGLADSMLEQGLICPVEITPDGTIICGHQRVAAAKLLGWEEIPCWVREDLVDAGEAAVVKRFLDDNLDRRQLTKLGQGRVYAAIWDQEHEAFQANSEATGDFRDYLGEKLGVDGKTAETWAQLAVLPVEYDQLIESGLLTAQLAMRIVKSALNQDSQQQLAEKLIAIMDSDLPRKEKKQKVREQVEGMVGGGKESRGSNSSSWQAKLHRNLKKILQDAPEPLAELAERVAELPECNQAYASICNGLAIVGNSEASAAELDNACFDVLDRAVPLLLTVMASNIVFEE